MPNRQSCVSLRSARRRKRPSERRAPGGVGMDRAHLGGVAVSPVVLGGGFSPFDSTLVSVVVVVVPPGVETCSVSLTFDSSPQPTRPNVEKEPRIRAVVRKRFMKKIPLL